MGSALDKCPTLEDERCCCCVPLRAGVLVVSALGMLWASFYLVSFGDHLFNGVDKYMYRVMWVNGLIGMLLAAAHFVLAAAAVRESAALCELYAWCLVLAWAMLVCWTVTYFVAMYNRRVHNMSIEYTLPVVAWALVLVSFYCMMVVANYRKTL